MDKIGDTAVLTTVIEDIEIRGVTGHFPRGPVVGYQWRYRLSILPTSTAGPSEKTTDWVFGSRESVEAMIEKWQRYLRDGTFGPGTQVQ